MLDIQRQGTCNLTEDCQGRQPLQCSTLCDKHLLWDTGKGQQVHAFRSGGWENRVKDSLQVYTIHYFHVLNSQKQLHKHYFPSFTNEKPISPSSKVQWVAGGTAILRWSLPPSSRSSGHTTDGSGIGRLSWDRLAVPDHAEKDLKPKYRGLAHRIERRQGPTPGIHILSKKSQITPCQSSTT